MKKKVICLTAIASTLAATAMTLLLSINRFNPLPAQGSDFVAIGTDVKKAAFVNDKSATVNTTFFDTELDETGIDLKANDYVVWSNDEDSPIRGISDLAIYTDLGSYGVYRDYVEVVCYTSYNHLDFIDVQLGKYDDLNTLGMFSFYPTPLGGGGNVKYSVDNDSARYFLMVIMTKIDLHISDVKVYSQCGDEPSGSEDIGEYDSYTEYELENLPQNFPFIGNGSYESSISPGSESTFYISGLKGLIDDFRYRLVEYGFTLVDISGDAVKTYTYEKDNPDKTGEDDAYFKLTRTEGIVYDDFVFDERITYYIDPTYWVGPNKSNWPTEHIASYLGNPGYAYIYSDPFVRLENVHYIIDGCFVFTSWNTIDEDSLRIVLEDTRAYRERLIDLGFILITDTFSPKSSGEPYGLANIKLYSPHLDYYMFIIYQVDGPNKKCSLTFEFRPKNEMSRTEFNEILLGKELPIFDEGNMVFLKEEDYYYVSPLTIKDLKLYAEALEAMEIDIGWVNKEQLMSEKIVIDRYMNSLIYQVHI